MGSTSVFYTTELENDLQVQIIAYNGEIGIDIRKWCLSSYSKTFPTKHGIRLNPENWTRFVKGTDGHIFFDEENISHAYWRWDLYFKIPKTTTYSYLSVVHGKW